MAGRSSRQKSQPSGSDEKDGNQKNSGKEGKKEGRRRRLMSETRCSLPDDGLTRPKRQTLRQQMIFELVSPLEIDWPCDMPSRHSWRHKLFENHRTCFLLKLTGLAKGPHGDPCINSLCKLGCHRPSFLLKLFGLAIYPLEAIRAPIYVFGHSTNIKPLVIDFNQKSFCGR
jgi:hypothetical protein